MDFHLEKLSALIVESAMPSSTSLPVGACTHASQLLTQGGLGLLMMWENMMEGTGVVADNVLILSTRP